MKYTLSINQKACVDLGIKNVNQAHIFALLMTASTWAKGQLMPDNQISYWVARQVVCDELALLNLKPDTVYRHMKSLAELGLIDYQKDGKKDMIRVTRKGKSYLSSRYVGNKSEHGDSTMSEINPSEVGNKSEKNSEINPTNQLLRSRPLLQHDQVLEQPAQKPGKSTAAWNAYSRAYLKRYGVSPLRGAKVNKLLCSLVDQVGVEQAPHVAAYYVTLNDQWYLKKSHDVPTLIQNAQGIFTQWATGTNNTSINYQQNERTSHNMNVANRVIEKLQASGEIE